MTYSLVSPEDFTAEQEAFIASLKKSVGILSSQTIPSQTGLVFGCKDINSKHIISTDSFAHLVALSCGKDVTDRFDQDMPWKKTAKFAEDYIAQDKELLSHKEASRKKSILNIHEYATGFDALVFDKYPLKHEASQSILGVIYASHKIEILNLATTHMLEFGIVGSLENIEGPLKIGNATLTEYEHEVCFLIAMNWSIKQISEFMNKHRPLSTLRGMAAIYKCKDRICQKINCAASHLRDTLIGMDLHKKVPSSFFNQMVGPRPYRS